MRLKQGVKQIEGVFDAEALAFLDRESCSKLDDPTTLWSVNKSNWAASDPYIANFGQAGTIITTELSDTAVELLRSAVKECVEFDASEARFNHQYMFRGAFIPWHTDTHVDMACTFYLQDWDLNHGGLYMYSTYEHKTEDVCHSLEDSLNRIRYEELKALCPKKNTMLLQHAVNHSVSALTPMCPVRRSIQAFITFAR